MSHLAILVVLFAAPVAAENIAVPSGQPVTFIEVIRDADGPAGDALRYRFLAPRITRDGDGIDAATAAADMDALCRTFVLPGIDSAETPPNQIIISMSDRPVTFGQPAPDATQFFESYRVENGSCVWEEF